MKNKISIDHINISVKSFKDSAHFYKSIFDFDLVEIGADKSWGILRNSNSMLCLHETDLEQKPDSKRINHFAFRVANIEPILEKLKKFNIDIRFDGEYKYPHSSSWYIFDPDGHSIEIVQWNNNTIKFNDL